MGPVDLEDLAGANPNWLAEIRFYVESHDFYPQAAIVKHEEGTSSVAVTIDRYGKVLDVKVTRRSGSKLLDEAWAGVFEHKQLPQPTPDMNIRDSYTFNMTLTYGLKVAQAGK